MQGIENFLIQSGYNTSQIKEVVDSWEAEKAAHVVACPRIKVSKIKSLLPIRYLEALEQNQKISSCCRHPENHEIEAWYADADHEARKVPSIYIFHCTCGRRHRRVCMGKTDFDRPFWEVR